MKRLVVVALVSAFVLTLLVTAYHQCIRLDEAEIIHKVEEIRGLELLPSVAKKARPEGGMNWGGGLAGVEFLYSEDNIGLQRGRGYNLRSGAAVTRPGGERLMAHSSTSRGFRWKPLAERGGHMKFRTSS